MKTQLSANKGSHSIDKPENSLNYQLLKDGISDSIINKTYYACCIIEIITDEVPEQFIINQLQHVIDDFFKNSQLTFFKLGLLKWGLIIKDKKFDMANDLDELEKIIENRINTPFTLFKAGLKQKNIILYNDSEYYELYINVLELILSRLKSQNLNHPFWLDEMVEKGVCLDIFAEYNRNLTQLLLMKIRGLEKENRIDHLTGLLNRRGFDEIYEKIKNLAKRKGFQAGLIFLDSDSLKIINDSKGHEAGDAFIKNIANILKKEVRISDFISCWGGDEFAVLLEDTDPDNIYNLAERIRIRIEEETGGSVSIGCACDYMEKDTLFQKADSSLNKAKMKGKNCTIVYS